MGRSGDSIRIYEINPQVIQIAESQFTYIKDTPAKLELALGDGRLVSRIRAQPAVRSARNGRIFRRLGAGPPDHP